MYALVGRPRLSGRLRARGATAKGAGYRRGRYRGRQAIDRGLPPALMPLAELQTLAGLEKLRREGRAAPGEAGWVLLGSS